MQTTLLGLGITVIMALLAALIGPLFIDWNQYRTPIEAEVSRVVGVPVRIAGAIDVRLLPTPRLDLEGIEVRPGGSLPLTARRLATEFALAGLLRGQFRATEITVQGPDVTLALDRGGAIVMPKAGLGFDPDRLAIDRLTIDNGRIALDDGASGVRLVAANVTFSGQVRSLLGPFKGEGGFTFDGEPYAYRMAASRRAADGGMKVRIALDVDPLGRALALESDGTVWIDGGSPRYEGAMTLARVVGTASANGPVTLKEPWKTSGRLKVTTTSVLLDQLEVEYGAEARAVHFAGTATMQLGRDPRIATVLTARQVDLDRALGTSDHRRLPFETIKTMAASLTAAASVPWPVRVSVGIDSLALGGGILQAVRGELEYGAAGWTVDSLELRAPGVTQARISGRLSVAEQKVAFAGPVKIDSNDPAGLFAWLEGRTAAGRPGMAPMRGNGELTLSSERIGIEKLSAEIDRRPVEGRLVYRFANGATPARVDAALSAADVDIDRGIALGTAMFASTSFDRPGEWALSIDLGHATYAGVEASKARAVMTFDDSGLKIERLSIADIGGAALDASGRIDSVSRAGSGAVTMSLTAPRLDGITALTSKFLPKTADLMQKYLVAPLRINAKLDMEPQPGSGGLTVAKLRVDGKLAGIDLTLDGGGTGDIGDPAAANLRLDGRLDAPDARMLAALTGFNQLVTVDRRPARLSFRADGTPNGSFQVDAKFAGTDTYASAFGALKASGDGSLDVAIHAADARLPRRAVTAAVPVDLRSRVAIDGGDLNLTDLSGKVAGTSLKGGLSLKRGETSRISGRIEADQVNASELIAVLSGAPPARGGASEWPTEPFGSVGLPVLDGRVDFRVASAQWSGGLVARDLAGSARFTPSGYALSDLTATIADGRATGDIAIRREPSGVALQSRVKLINADLPVLFGPALKVPVVGRISIDAQANGRGLSPAALVGAVMGSGTVTVEHVEIAGLDPGAIDAAIAAADRGAALGAARIGDLVNAGLDAGKLRLPFATAQVLMGDGRFQIVNLAAPAQNADVTAALAVGLNDGSVDLRIGLTGAQRKNAPLGERPAIAVTIKGPLQAPRRSADVSALANWLTARAVEQEAKRLDDAEMIHKRLEAEATRRQMDTGSAPPVDPGSAAPAQTSALGHATDAPVTSDAKSLDNKSFTLPRARSPSSAPPTVAPNVSEAVPGRPSISPPAGPAQGGALAQ